MSATLLSKTTRLVQAWQSDNTCKVVATLAKDLTSHRVNVNNVLQVIAKASALCP